MTVQEAIKSTRPFKRPHWKNWIFVTQYLGSLKYEKYPSLSSPTLLSEDLLADDWITEVK